MKQHRIGFGVVVICMLLLSMVCITNAQTDIFPEVEERASKAFEKDEPIQFETKNRMKLSTEFGARFTQSRVVYKEHATITDTESKWDAWMSRGDLLAGIYHENDSGDKIGLDIDFGLFRTTTEEENWDMDDTYDVEGKTISVVDQKNDTEFRGWELKLGLGYVQDFESAWEIKHKVLYGRRVIEFERRNLVITDTSGTAFPLDFMVDEKYTIDYIAYNPQLTADIGQKWSWSFSPGFAYVLRGRAVNDFFDTSIEAQEGFIANFETQVNYQFTEFFGAYVGGLGEWQYLEGDTTTENGKVIEWPDNDLFTYGLMLGITLKL